MFSALLHPFSSLVFISCIVFNTYIDLAHSSPWQPPPPAHVECSWPSESSFGPPRWPSSSRSGLVWGPGWHNGVQRKPLNGWNPWIHTWKMSNLLEKMALWCYQSFHWEDPSCLIPSKSWTFSSHVSLAVKHRFLTCVSPSKNSLDRLENFRSADFMNFEMLVPLTLSTRFDFAQVVRTARVSIGNKCINHN